jgi:DNA-binding CsgD family transcriptional regulator
MEKHKIKIACLETSDILYEGITNILMRTGHKCLFSRVGDVEELAELLLNNDFQMVIVNPSTVQNRFGEFEKLRRGNSAISWVVVSYSFIEPSVMELFPHVISIAESRANIVRKFEDIINKCCFDEPVREDLTTRERDVLIHLVNGESNKEISDNLNISIHTVISHRRNIVRKTKIKSPSGLAIYAVTSGIIKI